MRLKKVILLYTDSSKVFILKVELQAILEPLNQRMGLSGLLNKKLILVILRGKKTQIFQQQMGCLKDVILVQDLAPVDIPLQYGMNTQMLTKVEVPMEVCRFIPMTLKVLVNSPLG